MSVTEAQQQAIEAQKARIEDLLERQKELIRQQGDLNKVMNASFETLNGELSEANADEALIAYYDLGQQAAAGAAELVDSVLASVGEFLDGLFD